jgi:low affinity Fe/Cu permease
MSEATKTSLSIRFERFSAHITRATGSSAAFFLAMLVIIVWLVSGPFFHFSDTWQLVINTGTTIITFLMVFVIQHSQNKDTLAIQLKLNELIAANKIASNRLVSVEDLTEEELVTLKEFYTHLAILAKQDKDIFTTHSIDEAKFRHDYKKKKESVMTGPAENKQEE